MYSVFMLANAFPQFRGQVVQYIYHPQSTHRHSSYILHNTTKKKKRFDLSFRERERERERERLH